MIRTPDNDLPRNVFLWDERVILTDPTNGARVIDHEPLGDWLTERVGRSDERPTRDYLKQCETEIRERHPAAREYIVQVKAVYREFKYERDANGMLRIVPC